MGEKTVVKRLSGNSFTKRA